MNSMNNTPDHNPLFPVFLKPVHIRFLIIGGGNTASEKLFFLLKSSPEAHVTVIAPEFSGKLIEISQSRRNVTLIQRNFLEEDLSGSSIVIAATRDRKLNLDIRELARNKNILVNVADSPELCDFYLGSIVTRGDLKIAISTNGKSPVLAKRIREYLEDAIPEDVRDILANLSSIRKKLTGNFNEKLKILKEITSNLTVDEE